MSASKGIIAIMGQLITLGFLERWKVYAKLRNVILICSSRMRCLPYGLFCLLLYFGTCCVSANHGNAIGTSTDESFIYSVKKTGKSVADKDDDVFTVLRKTRAKSKKRKDTSGFGGSSDVSSAEFFPVVSVNNDVITNIDVLNAMKFVCFSSGKTFEKDYAKLLLRPIVDAMIADTLQGQYAKCLGATVSKTDVDEKVAEIAANNGLSIEQLEDQFKKFGISMEIFRKNIRSKMLLPYVVQAFTENSKISEQELEEVKAREESILQCERYRLLKFSFKIGWGNGEEIAKKNAESVLNLIKSGFDIHVLASVLSQDIQQSTMRWVTAQSLEKAVHHAVANLNLNECTDAIRTKIGYEIICLLDRATPGKTGDLGATYKVLHAQVKYGGAFFTQKDVAKTKEALEALERVSSPENFKKVCKEHGIEYKDEDIQEPSDYHMALINASIKKGATAMIQSPDGNVVDVVMFVNKVAQNAQIPDNETLKERLSSEKLERNFGSKFKKMVFCTHVAYPDQKTLNKIIQ
ncbi:MAG: SurA N-terminal domain-containing protein [Holosporales bacterium]|nr:SurA N-terminal domain-containing protein [Holosporales bacterium]